jgi:hypothetical protein
VLAAAAGKPEVSGVRFFGDAQAAVKWLRG